MKIVSSNDEGTVVDFQLAKRRIGQTAEEQHRESVIGPCPDINGRDLDCLEKGSLRAEILPNGQARLSDSSSDVFTYDDGWQEIFIPYNRLVHAVCNSSALGNLPNGTWVRVSVEICDKWEEHPSNPEYDERSEYGAGMEVLFCDPREVLLSERPKPVDDEAKE
jgi:hypothetical protein